MRLVRLIEREFVTTLKLWHSLLASSFTLDASGSRVNAQVFIRFSCFVSSGSSPRAHVSKNVNRRTIQSSTLDSTQNSLHAINLTPRWWLE
jgi:hypothetical protein